MLYIDADGYEYQLSEPFGQGRTSVASRTEQAMFCSLAAPQDQKTGCRRWVPGTNGLIYNLNGDVHSAQRLSYILFNRTGGTLALDQTVRQTCQSDFVCVEPSHLEPAKVPRGGRARIRCIH